MKRNLEKGEIVLVSLPEHRPIGHEQQGTRPAVVVGFPLGKTRFHIVMLAPLTTQRGSWVEDNHRLYPVLPMGAGRLNRESIVLLDQIRAVDARRLIKSLGKLNEREYRPVRDGVALIFG